MLYQRLINRLINAHGSLAPPKPIRVRSVFTISYSLGTFVGPIVAGALFQRVGFLWTMIAFCAIVLSALPVLMCADLAYADTVAVDSDGGGESGGPSASGAAGDSTAATVSTPLVSSAQASDDRAAAAAAAARIDAVTAALQDAADMGAGAHDGDDEDEEAGGGGGSYRRLPALTASDRVSP